MDSVVSLTECRIPGDEIHDIGTVSLLPAQIQMHLFSTSDMKYQMCYCCRKLDFQGNLKSASNVQLSD